MILRRSACPPGSPSAWPLHVLEGEGFGEVEKGSTTVRSSPDQEHAEPVRLETTSSTVDDATSTCGGAGSSSHDFPMKKATCARASRAARASDPSSQGTTRAYSAMYLEFQLIRRAGIERAPKEFQAFKTCKTTHGACGKGAAVKTSSESQQKMNHLAALKAKDIDSQNTEPAFLLGGFTTEMTFDRLAENSLKSNAVNSSVLNRKKTQGAANQTTRISCRGIGQAASSQLCSVALAMAEARRLLRVDGFNVVNPIATNSVNLCALNLKDNSNISTDDFFCITSTSRLIYNTCPVKLSSVSVLSTCIDLAKRELSDFYISNAMCSQSSKFADICKSIIGGLPALDAVWCSWIMITYLCSHPRGRDILKNTGLTDIDIQSAVVFERYGGEEIRRRVRQRKSSAEHQSKRPKGNRHDLNNSIGNSIGNSDAHSADDVTFVDEFEEFAELSGKRKRLPRGPLPSACSDSHGLIEFWHSALQSQDVSVLHTLASHTKRAARDAALSTLARQADGTDVGNNEVLQNVSLQNAIKSAKALVTFVGRRVDEIPAMIALQAENPSTKTMELSCGALRVDKEAASSALHACTLPPLQVRPPHASGIQIAWSFAAKKLMPTTSSIAAVPGILERYNKISKIYDREDAPPKVQRMAATMESFVDAESEMMLTQSLTGTTRSFLSLNTRLPFNSSTKHASFNLAVETKNMLLEASKDFNPTHKLPYFVKKSQDVKMRSEPIATPASPLALGICINEIMRRWMSCKTRKNDVCKVSLGFNSTAELTRECPGIMSSEPLPMLTMTDINMECIDDPDDPDNAEDTAHTANTAHATTKLANVSLGVHVCADAATRVPDLLREMVGNFEREEDYLKQCRAAIFVAASQASFVGAVGSSLSSGHANASVASSKKIVVPDTNKLMMLSPYDAYVGGLCNIVRSFDPGCYSGTYGCRVDTGWTPHGLFAHNFRSDKRQHGNCALSESAADELAVAFGACHWKVFEDAASKEKGGGVAKKYYTSVPIAVRGIPHSFIPGVHSALNSYCDFIETYRALTERQAADTVDSIMILPFSPFSQALPPDLESTADASLRTCFRDPSQSSVSSGRAYLPDSTSEETAIATEPLFRRPCQVSSGDCPFATSYENVDTFFNCANSMALMCRCLNDWHRRHETAAEPTEPTELMHQVVSMFIMGSCDLTPALSCWAADFLVMLNVLYPSSLNVGETAFLEAFAKAAPACHQALEIGKVIDLDHVPGLQEVDRRYARLFWSSFCRADHLKCAWKRGLKPLLKLIIEHDGSHCTPNSTTHKFKECLENAVKSVWLVNSPDGASPPPSYHPCHTCDSFEKVGRQQIDPEFVGSAEHGIKQRAAAIGLKPHSYRQVLSELLASSIQGVVCNVAINEGGLSLRRSSDPTILDEHGHERTDKSISPVQTEGDERAYGTRQDKIAGAVAQKNAWDVNALMMKPIFTAIEPPRHAEIRKRGEFGMSQFFQAEGAKMRRSGDKLGRRATAARNMLFAASDPAVCREVNPRL